MGLRGFELLPESVDGVGPSIKEVRLTASVEREAQVFLVLLLRLIHLHIPLLVFHLYATSASSNNSCLQLHPIGRCSIHEYAHHFCLYGSGVAGKKRERREC